MNKYCGDGVLADAPPALIEKTFEPIGSLVILQMVPRDKSPGGISLPDSVAELGTSGLEPAQGWVVSAGCQCRYARRGDLVLIQGQLVHFAHRGIRLVLAMETQLIGVERDAGGEMPEFGVTNWRDGVVRRLVDKDIEPTMAKAMTDDQRRAIMNDPSPEIKEVHRRADKVLGSVGLGADVDVDERQLRKSVEKWTK